MEEREGKRWGYEPQKEGGAAEGPRVSIGKEPRLKMDD
jgi:hypothetical protein